MPTQKFQVSVLPKTFESMIEDKTAEIKALNRQSFY